MGRFGAFAAALLVSALPSWAQNTSVAEGAVRSSIYNAFSPAQRSAFAPNEDLNRVIASADPATKAKALAALHEKMWTFASDRNAMAVIATGILDLGEVGYAKKSAETLYNADPASPSANMLMGRVAQAEGRLQDALKHYRAVPGADTLGPAARANLTAVQGDLERQGRPAGAALTGGLQPARATMGGGASAGSYNGLTRADLLLVAEMFKTEGSPMLQATLRKAAQGNAESLRDMRAHGIDVARGPAGQTDPVAIARDGRGITLSFSPAVLDNPDKNRAYSLMANGFEQAATQRDFQGVSRWLREWGGRAVGVIVYSQLVVKGWLGSTSEVDKQLVSDRIAYESAGLDTFPKLPNGTSSQLLSVNNDASKNVGAMGHFLYYRAEVEWKPYDPWTMGGDDVSYHRDLLTYPATSPSSSK